MNSKIADSSKKVELELNDLKHALDMASGIIIRDKDFRVTKVNNKFCKILGRESKEFVGEQYIQSKFGGIPNNEVFLQKRRGLLSQGHHWIGESCFLDKNNQQVWFTESTTPFICEQNKPYQYLSILTDITETKNNEYLLKQHRDHLQDLINEQIIDIKQARDNAENANKAKSEFLTNVSHELRSPLHAIISFTKLGLKQFQKPQSDNIPFEKLQTFFANIESSSQRLLRLLNNLLDLSKLEAGKETMVFKSQDLFQLSQQINSEFFAQTEEKRLKLIINSPPTPPIVLCDKNKILQVLANLTSNAIKFSGEKKSIFINFESTNLVVGKRTTDTIKTEGILISYTDQGLGIPEEELNTIFDKFIQSSKTKTGAGGTGLGLSICHEIISAHKGKIWAEHNPSGGSILKLFLPFNHLTIYQKKID